MNDLIICVEALKHKYDTFKLAVDYEWNSGSNYDFKMDDVPYLTTSEALLSISSDKVKQILSEKIKLKDILLNIKTEHALLFQKTMSYKEKKDIEDYTFSPPLLISINISEDVFISV